MNLTQNEIAVLRDVAECDVHYVLADDASILGCSIWSHDLQESFEFDTESSFYRRILKLTNAGYIQSPLGTGIKLTKAGKGACLNGNLQPLDSNNIHPTIKKIVDICEEANAFVTIHLSPVYIAFERNAPAEGDAGPLWGVIIKCLKLPQQTIHGSGQTPTIALRDAVDNMPDTKKVEKDFIWTT